MIDWFAKRIAELKAGRDEKIRIASDRASSAQADAEEWARKCAISDNRAEELEAKLGKAIHAFTRIADLTSHNMPMSASDECYVNKEARFAIAKLSATELKTEET